MKARYLFGMLAAVGSLAVAAAVVKKNKKMWTISYGKDGFALQLSETPLWAELSEDALEVLPCLHPNWEWMYKIGPKRFGVYDDGDPIRSLGGALHDVCNWRQSIAWRVSREFDRVPISREAAQKIDPDWVRECDRIFGDDNEDRPQPNEALRKAARLHREPGGAA